MLIQHCQLHKTTEINKTDPKKARYGAKALKFFNNPLCVHMAVGGIHALLTFFQRTSFHLTIHKANLHSLQSLYQSCLCLFPVSATCYTCSPAFSGSWSPAPLYFVHSGPFLLNQRIFIPSSQVFKEKEKQLQWDSFWPSRQGETVAGSSAIFSQTQW